MSQSSQDNGNEQVILFEAYCITSIKNYYKNYLRMVSREKATFNKLCLAMKVNGEQGLIRKDNYPSEYHRFQVQEFQVWIEDWLLGEALANLSEQLREIIFLKYFGDLQDKEIAERMNLKRIKTISEKKRKALSELRKYMEDHGSE